VEVEREGARRAILVTPDPGILRDLFLIVRRIRDSSFLRSRPGFAEALADVEATAPTSLRAAARLSEAYEVLNRVVGRFGASHSAIIPPWTYANLFEGEHAGGGGHAAGFLLDRVARPGGEAYFVAEVLDASPAARDGLLPGDEVVAVNGIPSGRSPRRALAGYESTRPRYVLQMDPGERIALEVRRTPGGPTQRIDVVADLSTSGQSAAAASRRAILRDGRRIAYIHLWNMLSPETSRLLEELLAPGSFWAEGLVVDLRGRGGQVAVANRTVRLLASTGRPVVLLVDRETRSAKELVAHKLKGKAGITLVGERTAGAVLPGEVVDLPGGERVMLPAAASPAARARASSGMEARDLELISGLLEGAGVEPDVPVARSGPYAAGADPILEAGLRFVAERLAAVPPRVRV
jgi:C-terminal processing protease CtpA/Prc